MNRVLRFLQSFSPLLVCALQCHCPVLMAASLLWHCSCKVLRPSPWTKVRHWDRSSRERKTELQTERERLRERERERDWGERERERDRDRDRDRETETVRDRDRQRQRQRNRDKDREMTETKTANRSAAMFFVPCWCLILRLKPLFKLSVKFCIVSTRVCTDACVFVSALVCT